MDIVPATWEIGCEPEGRISVKITLLDGEYLVVFLDEEEWDELKNYADAKMAQTLTRQKNGIGQENSHE